MKTWKHSLNVTKLRNVSLLYLMPDITPALDRKRSDIPTVSCKFYLNHDDHVFLGKARFDCISLKNDPSIFFHLKS